MTPIERLREEYKEVVRLRNLHKGTNLTIASENYYKGMRVFCLGCNILTFNEIELMEYEVDNEG